MLIFVFKLLKPFKSWFLTHPLWLTASLELEVWTSRRHAQHSHMDLQVEKTFLYMVSNVLACWRNRCYITSKGEKNPKRNPVWAGFCIPETSDPVWTAVGLRSQLTAPASRRASAIPGGVPGSSPQRRAFPPVRVTLRATRRPPQVVDVPGEVSSDALFWVLMA